MDAPSVTALVSAGLCSRQDVLVTKAIRNAEMRLRLQPRRMPQGEKPPGKLKTLLLNLLTHFFDNSHQIPEKLEDLHAPDDNATVETRWCQLRNVIQSTDLKVLRRARRHHQDWFDGNDAEISN
ncbi:unnamed protein product [Schistocephalus solidus]|uniref:Uncharacterized protein n=1 Tax=Schistocephalus solidus TaxID=70667 RepID=A0A183TPS7_SCHSO|nr:unnamed protein product [Schistocephalus solidus]